MAVKMLQGPSSDEDTVGELTVGEKVELLHGTHYYEDGIAYVPVQRSPSFGWATLEAYRGEASHVFMRPLVNADWVAGCAFGGRGRAGAQWELLADCFVHAGVEASSGILCKLPVGAVIVQTGPPIIVDGLLRLPMKPKQIGLPVVSGWCPVSAFVCSGLEDVTPDDWYQQSFEWPVQQAPYAAYETYEVMADDPFEVAPIGVLANVALKQPMFTQEVELGPRDSCQTLVNGIACCTPDVWLCKGEGAYDTDTLTTSKAWCGGQHEQVTYSMASLEMLFVKDMISVFSVNPDSEAMSTYAQPFDEDHAGRMSDVRADNDWVSVDIDSVP